MNNGLLICFVAGVLLPASCNSFAQSQESEESKVVNGLGSGVDCTVVNILYKSDAALTPAEKIQLMDQAFFDSLNMFDLCQNSVTNTVSGGGAQGGGAQGGGAQGGGAQGGGSNGGDSAASGEMSGTEIPADQGSGDLAGSGQLTGIAVDQNDAQLPVAAGSAAHTRNGKLAEDIPSADNDSILEAQIRHAATNESDPEIREKLWNEYRKYKGLANDEK